MVKHQRYGSLPQSGGGEDYLKRWRATANGLEGLAASHNNCMLVLDEISQADAKLVGEAAYLLANGSGKLRASRDGTLRGASNWRLLFLSSGEFGLVEHMALANLKPTAGQEVRLLDIPAIVGELGLFETIHNFPTPADFALSLELRAKSFFGTPAPAFLEKLVQIRDKLPELVKARQQDFIRNYLPSGAEGQASRAANYFALASAAGELATTWGLTGWRDGEATEAAANCFRAWLNRRGGAENLEAREMLEQVRLFLELHGSGRFEDWRNHGEILAPKIINRAGFRRTDDNNGETEYYIFREVFRNEVARGYDYKMVCKLLHDLGCLVTAGRSYDRKERLPGMGNTRCYRINSKIWEDHE